MKQRNQVQRHLNPIKYIQCPEFLTTPSVFISGTTLLRMRVCSSINQSVLLEKSPFYIACSRSEIEWSGVLKCLATGSPLMLSLMLFCDCHPVHIKDSLIYSLFLSYKRICARNTDFIEHSQKLATHLLHNAYPINVVMKQ